MSESFQIGEVVGRGGSPIWDSQLAFVSISAATETIGTVTPSTSAGGPTKAVGCQGQCSNPGVTTAPSW